VNVYAGLLKDVKELLLVVLKMRFPRPWFAKYQQQKKKGCAEKHNPLILCG